MVSLNRNFCRAVPLLVLLSLGGCAVVPYVPGVQNPSQQEEINGPVEPREQLVVPQAPQQQSIRFEEAPKSLPAAQRMRQLASAEGEKGEYRRAVALLERALRISPKDPETYYDLAKYLLLLDNPQQALQMAQRGLSHKPTADQRRRLNALIQSSRVRLAV